MSLVSQPDGPSSSSLRGDSKLIIVATTIVAVVAVLFAAMALAPALIETSLPQAPAKPTLRLVEPPLAIESIPQHPEAA